MVKLLFFFATHEKATVGSESETTARNSNRSCTIQTFHRTASDMSCPEISSFFIVQAHYEGLIWEQLTMVLWAIIKPCQLTLTNTLTRAVPVNLITCKSSKSLWRMSYFLPAMLSISCSEESLCYKKKDEIFMQIAHIFKNNYSWIKKF